ncbi:hypothetical protein AU359_00109 [Micrococcus luteus]|nr:hypothetical protein AU359_00109 [Micrococcus luteus]
MGGIERRGVTAGGGVRIRGGLLEGREERGAGGEPVLWILAQGAQHHGVERGRQVGVDVGGRRRLLAHVLVGHGQRRVAREGGPAREQLEQQAAGRVEVGAAVHGAARRLLRGQVQGGAHHGLGLRRGGGGVGQRVGDPEVHHLHGARVRDHDVRGLHVAVDDALLVRVLERFQHTPGPGHGTFRAHGALGVQDLPQRPAGDELHHQERAVHRMEAVLEGDLARVVHGDDRGVVQGGRRARLLAEARLEVRIARQIPAHQLHRHRAVQPQVLPTEDVRHAAAPDQLTDPVPPVQGPLLVHRHVRVVVPPAAQAEGVASAEEASAPRASADGASAPRASADGSVVG